MAIYDLLRAQGIRVVRPGEHHHARKGWLQMDCPTCGGQGRYLMGFNTSGRYFNCYRCGRKDGPSTLAQLLDISTGEAFRVLKEEGEASGRLTIAPRSDSTGRYAPPKGVGPLKREHRDYLRSRRFDPELIRDLWGVQGIGKVAGFKNRKYSHRLFIPITWKNKPVSWTTRSIDPDAEVRYLSARPEEESMPHKEMLYGLDKVSYGIIVQEGPIDCWAIGPGAVATCGVGYLQCQMALMAQFPIRVILFDSETAAQKRARRLANDLSAFPGKTIVACLDSAKDATLALKTKAGRKELRQLRRLIGA